jgi:hypothetical protein
MVFCTNCGKPVESTNKFCASCGFQLKSLTDGVNQTAPLTPPAVPPAYQNLPQAATPAQSPAPFYAAETIKCIISSLSKPKSWGRSDSYTLIVTDRRSIFAKITQEIMNEAVRDARANAAAEGKGFFGKWASQMKGFYNYAVRYNKLNPDQILQETMGNFAVENSNIRRIRITDNTDEESAGTEYGIEFQTATGKLDFKTAYNQEHLFKMAYGDAIVK